MSERGREGEGKRGRCDVDCAGVLGCRQPLPPLPEKEFTKLDRLRRDMRVKEWVRDHMH